MRVRRLCGLLFAAIWIACASHAADLSREQALKALEQPEAAARLAGVERLAEIGQMADADRLLGRLGDADPQVRAATAQAMWQIWSRSGDPAIDSLFARGVEQMQRAAYEDALAVFNEIVARKPEFAEGWNKRATLYFLLDQNQESLRDCDEVLKRNPQHFGALSGYGQIYFQLGQYDKAIEYWRRALAVNPNMAGVEINIRSAEELLKEKREKTI